MSHRFSPRPNRAGEIGWHEWSREAFEQARETDRPILLGISAVWCHWCHVMDETTYSDQRVIDLIRERYIPIRVDNDRRPDVNARYNMGGWPTTAFLTPSGEILTGATYVPPDDFARLLEHIASLWKEQRGEIERHLSQRQTLRESPATPQGSFDASLIDDVRDAIVSGYDPEYGGFGDAPKFPQTEALRFLLVLHRRNRAAGKLDERLYEILARTALAMARGGMYDHVEGGFFRYSTTRDWSIPHFEKMAEDHAGLLRFYADLYRLSGNEQFAQTLRSALRWLRTTLRNPGSALFGGSQDADEVYFALSLEERRQREAPFVDRTVYTNWNAALAGALLATSLALDDDTILDDALRALDALWDEMLARGGLALHFKPPGGSAQLGPFLSDQVELCDALIDGHAASGAARFLERAQALADRTIARMRGEDGAFVDNAESEPLGNLRVRHRPLEENAKLADALLRLAAITHEEHYAEIARSILEAFAERRRHAGSFAAPYGRAVLRATSEPFVVTVTGSDDESARLRDAALRLPDPLTVVHTTGGERALAHLCAGTRCAAPAADPTALAETYDELRQLPVR